MPAQPRSDRAEVRLTPEEKAAINEAAAACGQKPSEWIRDAVKAWWKKNKKARGET